MNIKLFEADVFDELNAIYDEDSKKKLNETSVRAVSDDWTIEESSILEYYPNKNQIQAYIDKAKAVELEEATKGYAVEVILYEQYDQETNSWPYYYEVLRPIKLYYDSTENPEVVKIFVQNNLMTESLEEAKSITDRTATDMRDPDAVNTANGYQIKVVRENLDFGGRFVYTLDQYRQDLKKRVEPSAF